MDRFNELVAQAYIKRFCSMSEEESVIHTNQKIEYAIVSVLSQGEKMIIIFLCAILLGMFPESLLIFLTILLTRRYLGGTHEGGYASCLLHSMCFFLCVLMAGKYISIDYILALTVFVLYLVMLICFAPIPSKQKPYYSKERRLAIKKRAAWGILILFILAHVFRENMGYIIWALLIIELDAVIAVVGREVKK